MTNFDLSIAYITISMKKNGTKLIMFKNKILNKICGPIFDRKRSMKNKIYETAERGDWGSMDSKLYKRPKN